MASHGMPSASDPLVARASGALWMPDSHTLLVSDLHLGKAERNARRGGGLWPPYENDATLSRLEGEVKALKPNKIIALGDSFDDSRCVEALAESDRNRIIALAQNRDLIWITGNHDPAPNGLPGVGIAELMLGNITLRHIAEPQETLEISGHYHPKATLHARGRRISRKCFMHDAARLILPAFGAYTGGLDVLNPAFEPLFGPDAHVILTGEKALRTPVSRLRLLAA
jgi:DNA ligase-associated metallophosphoesterase